MISLLWGAALMTPVLVAFLQRETAPETRRLQVALTLSLLGASATTAGDVASITSDPVVIERVMRGILAGGALLMAAPVLARRLDSLRRNRMPVGVALILYTIVAILSTAYSIAVPVTSGKAFEVTVGLVIVLAFASGEQPKSDLKNAVILTVALNAVFIAVAIVGFGVMPSIFSAEDSRPGFFTSRAMGAPYAHPNGLSLQAAVTASVCLAAYLRSSKASQRRWYVTGVAVGTLGVALSSGRQGLLVLVVSCSLVLIALRPHIAVLGLVPAASALWLLAGDAIVNALTRGQSTDLILSLSGRTVWWASAVVAWLEQPLLGFGFGAGGRFVALDRLGAGNVSSVHSGFLETLLGIGIIGFLPLAFALLAVIWWSIRNFRRETEMAVLVIALVVGTVMSLGVGGWYGVDLLRLMLLGALVDVYIRSRPRPSYAELLRTSRLSRASRTGGGVSPGARSFTTSAQ